MARYHVRNLRPDDFDTLMNLETELFGTTDDGVLGPYYVRLCCDFFSDACFLLEVEEDGVRAPSGYLLSFVRDREAYCTTLGILPRFQGTRALLAVIRAFVGSIADRVDTCWFTVEEDNAAARGLHKMLGAEEVGIREDFYGDGHPRIVSRIDRASLDKARTRFERLGLLNGVPSVPPPATTDRGGLWCTVS